MRLIPAAAAFQRRRSALSSCGMMKISPRADETSCSRSYGRHVFVSMSARRVVWGAAVVSVGGYLLVSLAHRQAFYPAGRLDYFDLRVYRGAGRLAFSGGALYDTSIWRWAPFTYPPFAALAFVPLAWMPFAADALLFALASAAALYFALKLALNLRGAHGSGHGLMTPKTGALTTAGAFAAAVWLEPVTATLGYGQIDLLVTVLIVGDLSLRSRASTKGALIGIAAGVKLTPLIFIPYLLVSGCRRAAVVATGVFSATVLIGFLALPADSHKFWSGLFLEPSRAGSCCAPVNQSLRGTLLMVDPSLARAGVTAIAVLVAILGVGLAALACRRGDEASGFCLCTLTGLLVSPVSWTHHWALAVPALLLMGVRAFNARSRLCLFAVSLALAVGYCYLPKLMSKPGFTGSHQPSVVWLVTRAPYVLIALGALAIAGLTELRRARADGAKSSPRWPRGLTSERTLPTWRFPS